MAEVGETEQMKKITALNIAAVIFAIALTACGSNDTGDMVKEPDLAETPDEPETYEDYMKLADTYLHKDDVLQALAVLDEGIEKLGVEKQSIEKQDFDLLSQRKECILAGTVAIRTELTENGYDDEGVKTSRRVSEYDSDGNVSSFTHETWACDVYGNEIEYVREDRA